MRNEKMGGHIDVPPLTTYSTQNTTTYTAMQTIYNTNTHTLTHTLTLTLTHTHTHTQNNPCFLLPPGCKQPS